MQQFPPCGIARRAVAGLALAGGLGLFAASCSSQTPSAPASAGGAAGAAAATSANSGGGTDMCESGTGIKDESAPFSFTAPSGSVVTNVCVKAGRETFLFPSESSCYAVEGLGTETATVTKIGSGRNCQDISHVVFTSGPQAPTPTATPTNTPVPEPTATPTNTPVPEATPTPVQEPTNTPVPEVTPTPVREPTNTPVPEVTRTPVQEPTRTPVPEVTPTPQPLTASTN